MAKFILYIARFKPIGFFLTKLWDWNFKRVVKKTIKDIDLDVKDNYLTRQK